MRADRQTDRQTDRQQTYASQYFDYNRRIYLRLLDIDQASEIAEWPIDS